MRERYQHAGAVLRAVLGVAALGAALSLGGALAAQVGGGGATMAKMTARPVARLAHSPDVVNGRRGPPPGGPGGMMPLGGETGGIAPAN